MLNSKQDNRSKYRWCGGFDLGGLLKFPIDLCHELVMWTLSFGCNRDSGLIVIVETLVWSRCHPSFYSKIAWYQPNLWLVTSVGTILIINLFQTITCLRSTLVVINKYY